MTDDARALLAAIVADPADDTARLAYADCIEERGNSARAAFIRVQIEAERLHPDSNARLALERSAEELFAEHWLDWWSEVCAAVGLPMPAPKPTNRLGRFARRVGFGTSPGTPYNCHGMSCYLTPILLRPPDLRSLSQVDFHRGFPDAVTLSSGKSPFLARWSQASPLHELKLNSPATYNWTDGSYLAGVCRLTLWNYDSVTLDTILQSPHLLRLEDLALHCDEYADEDGIIEEFADQAAEAVWFVRDRRLKRLSLQVWTDAAASAVAGAAHLASLTALDVDILPNVGSWESKIEGAIRRVETLSRSPHLAGLQELTVSGDLFRPAFWMIAAYPSWTGLRKLTINTTDHAGLHVGHLYPLLIEARLPALEELHLGVIRLNRDAIDLFARSPLLKQLRYFAFYARNGGEVSNADLRRLLGTFNLARIETVRIIPVDPMPALHELKRQLGDRLRMP